MPPMRAMPVMVALAACAVAVRADDAITADGAPQPVEAAAIANLADANWPGWVAFRRSVTPRDDDQAASLIGLDDGQRVGGTFNLVQDKLWWRSRAVGAMQVDLERVAWIGPLGLASQRAPERDHVAFVNGDHVDGFVNAIEAERGIEVESAGADGSPQRAWYDLGRIASVQLAPRPRAASGWRLWLRDGSVVDVDRWRRDESRVEIQGLHLPGAPPRELVAWDEILGIQRSAVAILPLASLAWNATDQDATPRLAPARSQVQAGLRALDVHPIDLHGPGTFTARVPDGRWTLTLSLVAPPALAARVGCTVQVLAGDRELARTRLGAGMKPTTLRAPVQGGDLRVVISEPAHGAFGAAVRLDDAMLVPVTAAAAAPTPAPTNAPAKAAGVKGPG